MEPDGINMILSNTLKCDNNKNNDIVTNICII